LYTGYSMNDERQTKIIETLARVIYTRLRNALIVELYLAFKDRTLTQDSLAEFFNVRQNYISGLVARRRAVKEDDHDAE
jgi:predicted XRE-type DNA-binding protein